MKNVHNFQIKQSILNGNGYRIQIKAMQIIWTMQGVKLVNTAGGAVLDGSG